MLLRPGPGTLGWALQHGLLHLSSTVGFCCGNHHIQSLWPCTQDTEDGPYRTSRAVYDKSGSHRKNRDPAIACQPS